METGQRGEARCRSRFQHPHIPGHHTGHWHTGLPLHLLPHRVHRTDQHHRHAAENSPWNSRNDPASTAGSPPPIRTELAQYTARINALHPARWVETTPQKFVCQRQPRSLPLSFSSLLSRRFSHAFLQVIHPSSAVHYIIRSVNLPARTWLRHDHDPHGVVDGPPPALSPYPART